MTKYRTIALLAGACLALSAVASWQEASGQGQRPLSGPYVPSPTTIPSPVTPPGSRPPVISPPRPITADPSSPGGAAQKPLRQPPLPPSPGACRSYPGTIAGQPNLPPC